MENGEIRIMSPKLLAVQFSGALFDGLAYFIRTRDIKDSKQVGPDGKKPDGEDPDDEKSDDKNPDDEKFLQDVQDATESCMMILQPNWRFVNA